MRRDAGARANPRSKARRPIIFVSRCRGDVDGWLT
jgi:hypothetical protein